MTFPTNIILLATHASYFIPKDLQDNLTEEMKNNQDRLLKNFSDHATAQLIPKDIPETQKTIANFSRALGDPNRSLKDIDLFREKDFNNIPIWKKPLNSLTKEQLIATYYINYHNTIHNIIESAEKRNKKILIIDLHDTGSLILTPDPKEDRTRIPEFPQICLSNLNNSSAAKKITQILTQNIEKYFGITPNINDPYKGGYITQKYGAEYNKKKSFTRNVIQLEFCRTLYMDEKTQQTDENKLEDIKNKLRKTLLATGKEIKKLAP